MKAEMIHQLVSDKNKELEHHVLRHAEGIIAQIADCQNEIEDAGKKIVELRKELKGLEVVQINAKTILGEE